MKTISLLMCSIMLILSATGFAFSPFDSNPYITPTATPQTSVYINWNTAVEESSIVGYGLTPTFPDTVRVSGVRYYHHVTLSGLAPGTDYYYQVIPGGMLQHFKTFPLASDTFTFVAFGDTRSDSVAHQSVIDMMASYEFAFYTLSGDLVNDGNNTDDWRIFFNTEDTLLQNIHFLPAIGNHESPYWQYDTLFALCDSEDYYSLEYGNTHFIVLNTHIDLYGDQIAWLTNDLINASNDSLIDWIFVSLHRPPYSSGGHGSQLDVRAAWCRLFEQYNVDIVFTGHDHHYERTIPINGVVYFVTGGGGAPLRPVGSNTWTACAESAYHFCLIDITDRKLFLHAIKPDGTIFDSLYIDKSRDVKEKKTEDRHNFFIQPNPFSVATTNQNPLLTRKSTVVIYDKSGSLIRTIRTQEENSTQWYDRINLGQEVEQGVYSAVLDTDPGKRLRTNGSKACGI